MNLKRFCKGKEVVYVTYTCKKCGKAFIDIDINDNINELPLKTRYCPECVAKGYLNDKLKKKQTLEQLRNKEIKKKIKEAGYTDERDIKFLTKYVKKQISHKEKTNQRIYLDHIFKDGVEVLGYQSWK